jgi:histidyl-tRNA synthetase
MRRADKLKARYTLILGEEELKRGRAVLRDMVDKSQQEIPLPDLLDTFRKKVFSD